MSQRLDLGTRLQLEIAASERWTATLTDDQGHEVPGHASHSTRGASLGFRPARRRPRQPAPGAWVELVLRGPDGEIALTTQVYPDPQGPWALAMPSSVRVEPGGDHQRAAPTGDPQVALRTGDQEEATCEVIESSEEGLSFRYRLRELAFQPGMTLRTHVIAADGSRVESQLKIRNVRIDPLHRGHAVAGAQLLSGPSDLARWLDEHKD